MLKAIIYFVVLAVIYVIGYYLNSKTKVPAGCEKYFVACSNCQDYSCGANPVYKEKKND